LEAKELTAAWLPAPYGMAAGAPPYAPETCCTA